MTRSSLAPRRYPARAVRSPDSRPGQPLAASVGLAAVVFSALYLLSDVLEVAHGGFSASQLWLTLVAEAALPAFVVGLAKVQGPRFGRLGWASAWAYAYSYTYFTGTVVYALARHTDTYQQLSRELGAVMLLHGAVMVVAGIGFGTAALRARVVPGWTAAALMVGVVLVALSQDLPAAVGLVAAALRDIGFAGMGVALLRSRLPSASGASRRRKQLQA
jgi:hypothetical protein